jgi:hypothetical protein
MFCVFGALPPKLSTKHWLASTIATVTERPVVESATVTVFAPATAALMR